MNSDIFEKSKREFTEGDWIKYLTKEKPSTRDFDVLFDPYGKHRGIFNQMIKNTSEIISTVAIFNPTLMDSLYYAALKREIFLNRNFTQAANYLVRISIKNKRNFIRNIIRELFVYEFNENNKICKIDKNELQNYTTSTKFIAHNNLIGLIEGCKQLVKESTALAFKNIIRTIKDIIEIYTYEEMFTLYMNHGKKSYNSKKNLKKGTSTIQTLFTDTSMYIHNKQVSKYKIINLVNADHSGSFINPECYLEYCLNFTKHFMLSYIIEAVNPLIIEDERPNLFSINETLDLINELYITCKAVYDRLLAFPCRIKVITNKKLSLKLDLHYSDDYYIEQTIQLNSKNPNIKVKQQINETILIHQQAKYNIIHLLNEEILDVMRYIMKDEYICPTTSIHV